MLSYLPQFKLRFINLIFQQTKFQIRLKITQVVTLFKKGTKTKPVSILSIVSTITKKIMSKQIHVSSETLNVLSTNQDGFRPGRSTAQAISVLLEVIHKKLDQGIAQCIFLDYSMAFDTINHKTLLLNLFNL